MKIEIIKIKIQLKEREIELTSDEARSIREELNKLFDKDEPPKIDIKEFAPAFPVYQPIFIERDPCWPKRWEVTCGGSDWKNGTLCMSVGTLE